MIWKELGCGNLKNFKAISEWVDYDHRVRETNILQGMIGNRAKRHSTRRKTSIIVLPIASMVITNELSHAKAAPPTEIGTC